MKKIATLIIILSGALCCFNSGFAQKNSLPSPSNAGIVPLDGIIAIVNSQVITTEELRQAMILAKEQMNAEQIPLPNETVLRRQVLNAMINRTLQLEYAKKMNIQVSDEELNQAIVNIAKENHLTLDELRASIVARGMNYEEYRGQIREQIIISQLQQRVITPEITVSDQEVDTFAKNYVHQNHSDTEYHVFDILIPLSNTPSSEAIVAAQKRAQQLTAQLRKGANFQALAAANSAGQQALQGGDLGWRKLAELPTVFAEQVNALNIGQVSDPIRAANGFHIIKLVDLRNSSKNLTPEQIKQSIFERKYTEQLEIWLQQLRDSSYVKIMSS